jgi:hypothetical protein
VFRLIMDVLIGNRYEHSCVYEPSAARPRDHVPLLRCESQKDKRKKTKRAL